MDKVIVVANDDGSCSIVVPMQEMFDAESRTRKLLDEKGITFTSDEEVLDWIIKKDVPEGKSYRVITKDALPNDRTFRNAWTDSNPTPTVDVDMTKAKEMHKDTLRVLRVPKLQALDVEYMRALEAGKSTTAIVKKKQLLRDITNISLPNTPDELKAYIPDCLKD